MLFYKWLQYSHPDIQVWYHRRLIRFKLDVALPQDVHGTFIPLPWGTWQFVATLQGPTGTTPLFSREVHPTRETALEIVHYCDYLLRTA